MRKILPVMVLLAISTSATARVNLDEIEVRSFLNQPLQAQFRVEGSVLDSDDIQVRIASEEAYRRAGLQWSNIPEDLGIETHGTGASRVVRLSTLRPVRDPYLGLLVEIRWPAGRVLREFNILLDPAVSFTAERSAAPVLSPAPEPDARTERREPVSAPVRGSYTVRRGDTLSTIVQRQGYSGVTMSQAMLAVLEANTQAFVGGNVHRLRAGAELHLPSQAEIAAYDRRAAFREMQRQTDEWRAQLAPRPSAVASEAPVPPLEAIPEHDSDTEAKDAEKASQGASVHVDEVVDRLEILGEDAFEPTEFESTEIATAGSNLIEGALFAQQIPGQDQVAARERERELEEKVDSLTTRLEHRDQWLDERNQLIEVMQAELSDFEQNMRVLREQQEQYRQQIAETEDLPATWTARLLSNPVLLALAGTSALLFALLLAALLRIRRIAADGVDWREDRSFVNPVPVRPVRTPKEKRTVTLLPGRPKAGGTPTSTKKSGTVAGSSAIGAGTAVAAHGKREPEPESLANASRNDDAASRNAIVDEFLAGIDSESSENESRENSGAKSRETEPQGRSQNEPVTPEHSSSTGDGAKNEDESRLTAAAESDEGALKFDFDETDVATGSVQPDTVETRDDPVADESDEAPLHFDFESQDATADTPERHEDATADMPERHKTEQENPEDHVSEGNGLPELSGLTLPELNPEEPETPAHETPDANDSATDFGMKLTMAEALAEMGDMEGALETLDEAQAIANDAQKEKVEALRRQIERTDG